MEGGYAAIYETPNYQKFRRADRLGGRHKYLVGSGRCRIFFTRVLGMSLVGQQFFPNSDRTEILVDIHVAAGREHQTPRRHRD